MLEFARWKYWLVGGVLLLSLFLALPNIFGEDLAVQVAAKDRAPLDAAAQTRIEEFLRGQNVALQKSYIDEGRVMLRFADAPAQLRARDAINDGFKNEYVTALSYAPRAPAWLRAVGLRPMPLGLDLRGGLYLLYQVDVNGAVGQLLEVYEQDFRRALSAADVTVRDVTLSRSEDSAIDDGLRIVLAPGADVAKARAALRDTHSDLTFSEGVSGDSPALGMQLSPAQIRERQDYAIQQNITTLRNRVNELGVAEPIVQRQGLDRIAVQLPGVQNSAEVKDILGKVATLEFRLVDVQNSVAEAVQRGRAPLGSKLYHEKNGQPVLLKRDIIVTGDQLTDATTAATQEGPGVSVKLDSLGGEEMLRTTRANLNRPMAVVFIEKSRQIVTVDGRDVEREIKDEKVISVATIRGVFSNNFQITGLLPSEARELSLLLRAGSLAAPIYIVEERAVGPSLGQENINKGLFALLIGMLVVFAFIAVYYKSFGLVACVVLLANVVMLAALLSGLRAALTLPGIAGIILTVGMAIDANILIYERVREELRNGVSPQAAIRAGFEKAFSAIADANITTLIAGVVLWVFGTGPIRGFAVVLTLGILTSMFTALLGARALITLMYGGRRRIEKLAI
ncbi:MAG: protein translocase subunit SecD [Steroidobacteraceae bacterium]